MTSRRLSPLLFGAALLAPVVASPLFTTAVSAQTAGAAQVDTDLVIDYLASSQQADGGFDLSGFPGFETPDVILAIAADANSGRQWDVNVAAQAVRAFDKNGADPFDAIDHLVDAVEDPNGQAAGAQAAKVIALVAGPTGLSATDFDPSNDSVAPVDLVARMNRHRTTAGGYDFGALFNGSLYAALAHDALGQPVPGGLLAQIRSVQRPDGSWNYAGDLDAESPGEIDTTALAVLALKAAGLDSSDATVADAVGFLADGQQASGAWQAFGADDANSTSMAALSLSAVRVDLTDARWAARFGATPPSVYVSPYAWLATQQNAAGRIISPNDEYGVNNFATAQALQAVSSQWHLRADQQDLVGALAQRLASSSDAARAIGHRAIGTNVSIRSARDRAAYAVAMSQPGREAAAAALFDQALGRRLDSSGRSYWSAQLQVASRSSVLGRLTGSAEFYALSGSTTHGFVKNAYEAVLGRNPDAAGLAYWSARLDAGVPVESIAISLVVSREYRQNEVDVAYQQMLGRDADAAGRAYWTDRLLTTRVEVILAGIGGSGEFFSRNA